MNLRLERYYTRLLMPFGKASKSPVLTSKRHMAWLHERPCIATGAAQVDAHHVQFRSHGQNDYTAVPLTHELHMRGHSMGFDQVEIPYSIDLKDALIATLIERVYDLECELNLRKPI